MYKTLYEVTQYQDDLRISIKNTVDFRLLAGKRIMITGATGLVGSYLADMFSLWNLEQSSVLSKIQIYVCSRSAKNLEKRFKGCWEASCLHFIEQDFNEQLHFDEQVDFIIHAASNAYPAAFNRDPVGTMLTNIIGTNELLQYANAKKVKRFVFISTGEVYGEMNKDVVAFLESHSGYIDITSPRSCYPSSKRVAETLCVSYGKQFGVDVVIARLCHTYGPNVTGSDNRATAQFIYDVLVGHDIILKSKGLQLRSYSYIADCASGILSIMTSGECGQAYNIANPDSRITISDFAHIVAEFAGKSVKFMIPNSQHQSEETPISRAVLDSHKAELLGWRNQFGPREGIKHTMEIMNLIKKAK